MALSVIFGGMKPARPSWPGPRLREPMGSNRVSRWGQTEFQVNLKLGLTSRQEARERRIVASLKPFRWNPAGNQSRPVEPDQQPEASLAWWVGNHPCEA